MEKLGKTGGGVLKYKILLIIGICLGAAGQIFMKLGADGMNSDSGGKAGMLVAVFTNPYVIAGLFFMGLSMLMWLTVISKLDLSFAYPVVSLSYVIILLFGWLVFHENINALRISGVVCIMAGVIIISRTGGDS